MQKKRTVNKSIIKLFASCMSQRRMAIVLRINIKTVVRKFIFLGLNSTEKNNEYLNHHYGQTGQKLVTLQFDEMETFEKSKYQPLSVPIVVDPVTRKLLGFRVCSMPAKGLLADIARKKYGPRADDREQSAKDLLRSIAPFAAPDVTIITDQNPKYPAWIDACFPNGKHLTTKGRRGCVVGQGELKSGKFDPLFALNHTCAMIRANVNRLFRRTWNTTKRAERLALHLAIYMNYHNTVLT